MAENKLKDQLPPEEKPARKPKKNSIRSARKILRFINVFGVFDRNQIVHAMPFILFFTMLIIVYIGNSYYAEKIVREIEKTKSELIERRAESNSTKKELMNSSLQSSVASSLKPTGIKESVEPPRIILVEAKRKNFDKN